VRTLRWFREFVRSAPSLEPISPLAKKRRIWLPPLTFPE